MEIASAPCTDFADTVCSPFSCSTDIATAEACEDGWYRSGCISVGDTLQPGVCVQCTYSDPTQCQTGYFLDAICEKDKNPQADNQCVPCNQYSNCDAGKHVSERDGGRCSQHLEEDVICASECQSCFSTQYESQVCTNEVVI
jgi:hypothetical protein